MAWLVNALLSDQKFGDDGVTSSLNFSSGIGLSGLQMLIGIILAAVLGWRYLKMMVQYVKRYVRYQLLRVLAPVGICTIGSNSTRQMAQNYLKLYISSTLSMLLSGMMMYIYCWAMMQTLLWESDLIADNILLFCITLGILIFSSISISYWRRSVCSVPGCNRSACRLELAECLPDCRLRDSRWL